MVRHEVPIARSPSSRRLGSALLPARRASRLNVLDALPMIAISGLKRCATAVGDGATVVRFNHERFSAGVAEASSARS